jgi:hypothetical protein
MLSYKIPTIILEMWSKFVKKAVILLVLLTVVPVAAFSQQSEIDVNIRFFNKELYYPDSSIMIKVEITNESASPYHFELADNRIYNISFDVRTLTNEPLPQSQQLIIERSSNQRVFFRNVTIGPSEQFSFYEDLSDYVDIIRPGAYVVQATFYPEINVPGVIPLGIVSNNLSLSVRPSMREMTLPTSEDAVQMARLQKVSLPPDEVVSYTLRARQRSQWENFFLYLDVESLLKNDPARRRRFLQLSQEERMEMLNNYKQQLRNEQVDGDIIVIPDEFEVIKTEYTPEEATVQVIERFQYPGYVERKHYTYYLKKRDNVWFIYDYSVRNLGTE